MVDAGQAFLAGKRLKLEQRQEQFNREQVFVTQNQAIADTLIKSAAEIQANAAAVGKTADLTAFKERLEGLVTSATAVRVRQFGTDEATALQFIDTNMARFEAATAAAASAPTPVETAQVEGRAAVAGAASTAEALTEGGVPTSTAATAEAAGLIPEPAGEPTPSVTNFRMPDGSIQAVDINDTAKVRQVIDNGGVKISLSVQSPGLEGVGAVSGVTKKERENLKTSVQDVNASIEEVDETLKQFTETPEAGGILGVLIENVGGLIQQVPGGQNVLDTVGVDPAQVKAVRSNARTTASRLLSTITGEESGRFTDTERKIAEEALATLDPTSSEEQISAALNQALNLLRRAEGRQMVRFLQASGADLTTDEGAISFTQSLIDNGFTQDRAIDAMLDLKERLSID